MNNPLKKQANLALRKARIRAMVKGTTGRPRLSVFISNRHISAQIIDDTQSRTLAASTSATAKVTGTLTEKAAWVGSDISKKAKKAGITKVVLDRNGRHYQRRLSTLADAARKEGMEF